MKIVVGVNVPAGPAPIFSNQEWLSAGNCVAVKVGVNVVKSVFAELI